MSSTQVRDSLYVMRAMAAYYRSDAQSLVTAAAKDFPNHKSSVVREEDGLRYIFLRSSENVLAVYRIDNTGRLKSLKRWPRGTDGYYRARDQFNKEVAA